MARLGRGQPGYRTGHSTLRPPAVVGAAAAPFLAPPIKTKLAEESRNQIAAGRRASHYELRAPTVTFDAVVWHGPGVKLAPPRNLGDAERRRSGFTLRPPTVVGPVQVYGPIAVEFAKRRARWQAKSELRPPEVVTAIPTEVYPGPKVTLARAKPGDQRRKAQYDLAAPVVVFPGGQLGGLGTSLADAGNARSDGRRAPNSRLAPPAVVDAAAVAFTADAVRVNRAESHRPAATRSELRAPAVVDPVVVYPGPQTSLAPSHRPAPTHPKVRPPVVVDPAVTYRPVATYRAEPHRPPGVRSELRAPTVIGPANIYGPVAVELAKVRQSRPVGHTELAAPTVLDPAVIFPAVRLALAEARKPRLVQSELRPPTVIDTPAQPPVDTAAEITLAPSRDVARRLPKSTLRAPEVVGPAVVYPPVSATLAPQPRQARATHSRLSEPAAITPATIYPSVATTFAPQPRQARAAHSTLAPPTVVTPFLPEAVRTTYAPGRQLVLRRPARSTLRDPIFYPATETTVAVALADHPQRREYRSFRTPIFGILDVQAPVLGHFDEPTPAGAFFDEPTPGGAHFDRSGPSAATFDEPTPGAGQFDEPTPTAGHFDEPTPT